MSLRSLGANDNLLYLNLVNPKKLPNRNSELHTPLRNTRLIRVTTGGGALAKNSDNSRVVVVGKESLRILEVASPDEHGAPHFEPSKNYWEGSGLKADSALTDVVWAHGIYSSKVITSSRNGDLALWDLSRTGSKLERRTRNHLRAIHQISLSPNLPHYCVSGSADGDIRAWDLRELTRSILRLSLPSGVRAVAFSPDNTHALQLNLGLDDGSLQRVDLRLGGTKGVLDRLPVAHAGPILSLDWVPPSGMPLSDSFTSRDSDSILASGRNPAGWIASAGLDKTVKIWPAEFTGLFPSQPAYTLAATWPVRRVRFRPGHATELVIVSNAEQVSVVDGGSGATTPSEVMPCAGEVVQIWDVRRENIPKWSIPTAMSDGSVSDIVWGDSRVLWAQHASGTFAQLDVMDAPAPVNSVPRSTVACSPLGMVSFALDTVREREIPFEAEAISSDLSSFEHQHSLKSKKLGDAAFRPETQNCGTVPLQDSDGDSLPSILTCAKYYRISGSSKYELCLINGKVAEMANQPHISQLWFLAASLIEELVPEMSHGTSSPAAPMLMHSVSAPSTIPTLNALSQPVSSTPRKPVVRRAMTESIKGYAIFSSRETAKHLISSNNGSRRGSPAFVPGIGDSPRLSPAPSPTPSPLRQTIALPVPRALAPHVSPSNGSQDSRSANAVGITSRERPSFSSYTRPPAGFDPMARRSSLTPSLLSLTSPSNASRSPTDAPLYGISGERKHPIGEGALDGSSDEDEAEDAAVDGGDEHDDRETDEDPGTPIRPTSRVRPGILSQPPRNSWAPGPLRDSNGEKEGSSSDDHVAFSSTGRPQFPRRMSLRKKRERRDSNAMLMTAPKLMHQASTGSIGTVTGHNDTTDQLHIATSVGTVMGGLAPRTSISENFRTRQDNPPRSESFQRLPSGHRDQIATEERQIRALGWLALKAYLGQLADEGDVQTYAMLGLVCPDTLLLGSATIAYYVRGYLDLLDRLQLHGAAAHVRKFCNSPEIRSLTTVNTTIYTSCAGCKKPIISPATHIKHDIDKPSGAFSFCMRCRRFSICSICRLPTRGLSFYCTPCGHGGHWSCYRQYRNSCALLDNISPNIQRAKNESELTRFPDAPPIGFSGSYVSEQVSTGYSNLATGNYPCAAGCGHICSFGN